jgi:glucose/arabinose dehydrogenase
MGLLGLAFHPQFEDTRLFYLNYTPKETRKTVSRVAEWRWEKGSAPKEQRVIMEVEQPYQNHNAGALAFGPDGYLYIGWGDGGWADDPHDNAQNPRVLLGKMLRIDVDKAPPGKSYRVPDDNPFTEDKRYAPEIWALGLRNPWRYSFDSRGRLIVADVGQNEWEEISIVEKGVNYGWRIKEASHCFNPPRDCAKQIELRDPITEYGRDDGQSITGGYEYKGNKIPPLAGHYVFGDFVSGRIWALRTPEKPTATVRREDFTALGRWPIAISTFGQDSAGEIFVADFSGGVIYQLCPND